MRISNRLRLAIIGCCALCLYFAVGLLLPQVGDVALDDYFFPGLTVEHWHDSLRFRIVEVKPVVLAVSLVISFAFTWSLFWVASRFGKRTRI